MDITALPGRQEQKEKNVKLASEALENVNGMLQIKGREFFTNRASLNRCQAFCSRGFVR